MGNEQTFVKVDSSTLNAKASDITTDYPTMSASAVPPCMLILSGLAMRRMDQNYQLLLAALTAGKAQAARVAACLQAAGRAYDEVDAISRAMIESGSPATGTDAVSVNPTLPPAAPPPPSAQPTSPPEDQGVEWTNAVAQIDTGDQGASLLDFAHSLYLLSDKLTAHGKKFSMGDTHWEGAAATAAEGALRRHESWLYDLAEQTRSLAQQAQSFADVHISEHPKHPTQADVTAVGKLTGSDWLSAYSGKQQQSDDVRRSYASRVNFADLSFKSPPEGAYPSAPVAAGDVAPRSRHSGGNAAQPGRAGGGAGSGGGQPRAAGPSASPLSNGAMPGQSPAEQRDSNPQVGQPSGGSPGSGSPSGGQGTGGGTSPAAPSTGSGVGGGRSPVLPDGPSVRPAAASGGSGGGAGGGGLGGQPLQPAASAPALRTSPASGGASAGGPSGTGGGVPGSVMGGAMGPMAHGAKSEGAKEKKRNPDLSLDETLYVENRPYTDPVVGHTRRTRVDDKREMK